MRLVVTQLFPFVWLVQSLLYLFDGFNAQFFIAAQFLYFLQQRFVFFLRLLRHLITAQLVKFELELHDLLRCFFAFLL